MEVNVTTFYHVIIAGFATAVLALIFFIRYQRILSLFLWFAPVSLRTSLLKSWGERWTSMLHKDFNRTDLKSHQSHDISIRVQQQRRDKKSAHESLSQEFPIEWPLGKAIDIMQLGVTITDLKGRIIYSNPAEARMHGYTVDELIGQDLGILAPENLRHPMTVEQIKKMDTLRESVNIRKDGSIFPVRLMANVFKDNTGEPVAIVTTCEDISEYKYAAERLRRHTRELILLNHLSDSLQECEQEEDTYRMVAEVCQKLLPRDSGCLCIMDSTESRMNVVESWGNPSKRRQMSVYKVSRLHSGNHAQERPFLCPHRLYNPHQECLSIPIVASDQILGLLSLCFNHPWSDRKQTQYQQEIKAKQMLLIRLARHYALTLLNLRLREQLRIEAIHDPLTGLYNRRYMEDSLKREAYRAKRHNGHIGIIMLDIDHFKLFNDLHGHKVGDMVLRELGAFMKTHVRGEDIACRYGGEEFLLILPNATLEIARQRAEELRLNVKQLPFSSDGKSFEINVSLGVAVLPDHSFDILEVVHKSDIALYQAKNQGRDRVIVANA